jgi:hypothetical protein
VLWAGSGFLLGGLGGALSLRSFAYASTSLSANLCSDEDVTHVSILRSHQTRHRSLFSADI